MSATAMTPTMGLGRPIQCNDVGTGPASLVTVEEFGPPGGAIRQTKFTFNSATFTLTRTSGAIASGGIQFYDLPKGNINILNATAKITYSIAGAGSYSNLVSAVGSGAYADGICSNTKQPPFPSLSGTVWDSVCLF